MTETSSQQALSESCSREEEWWDMGRAGFRTSHSSQLLPGDFWQPSTSAHNILEGKSHMTTPKLKQDVGKSTPTKCLKAGETDHL